MTASSSHTIILVCYNKLEDKIKARLKKRLSLTQLKQVEFRLPFKRKDYYGLLKNAHVILESFPFGGGNTVLHSMAAGTPVISLQSNQLKGSFGTGFYKWIGELRFIAKDINEYVELAIKTAHNNQIKAEFKAMIQKNKPKLFGNMSGSHEFYKWLEKKLK